MLKRLLYVLLAMGIVLTVGCKPEPILYQDTERGISFNYPAYLTIFSDSEEGIALSYEVNEQMRTSISVETEKVTASDVSLIAVLNEKIARLETGPNSEIVLIQEPELFAQEGIILATTTMEMKLRANSVVVFSFLTECRAFIKDEHTITVCFASVGYEHPRIIFGAVDLIIDTISFENN